MWTFARRAVAVGTGALAIVTWVPAAPAAVAAPVPYTDNAVTGSVGLCSPAGRPVTYGNINDKPFVWRAVSSTPASPPYDGRGRKATLIAYQPRTGANPNLWSGDTLTSSSTYTNPRYPMAQATTLDFSLEDFLHEFPPLWDGLIQLRIYLSAPGQQPAGDSYPATDIRITGDTWAVVRGASVSCTDGSATASEILPPTVRNSGSATGVPPSRRPGAPSTASTSRSPSGSGSGRSAAGASTGRGASTSGAPAAVSSTSGGSASKTPAVLAGLGAALLAGVGATYWWRRRRIG